MQPAEGLFGCGQDDLARWVCLRGDVAVVTALAGLFSVAGYGWDVADGKLDEEDGKGLHDKVENAPPGGHFQDPFCTRLVGEDGDESEGRMDAGFCSIVSETRAREMYAFALFYIRGSEAWTAHDYLGTVIGECKTDLAAVVAGYGWAVVGVGEREGGLEV